MRGRIWRQRLPVIICALLILNGSGGFPSTAQEHSPLATPSPVSTDQSTPPRPPFAQEKIETALAAGTIDYPTSLLYRAYALFGDPRLPGEYDGAGSFGEDSGLAREVELAGAAIPPAIEDALIPFLVRPTDPRSYFNQPPANARRAPSLEVAVTPTANPNCQDGWFGRRSTNPAIKLKVWASCDGTEEEDIAFVLPFAESLWTPMTRFMGPPRADAGDAAAGGDDAIDIYLVYLSQEARDSTIPEDAFAAAWSAGTIDGNKSSGFMLMPRFYAIDGLSNSFKLAFAHEFFHVLQFAHNYAFQFRWNGDFDDKGNLVHDEFWFVEASATWAETYFVRPLSRETHEGRFKPFQSAYPGVSLHASNPQLHEYAAYIWPFFMQQEVKAKAIADVWKALEAVAPDDWDAANKAIDAQLRFSTHFRDFAVRNYNKKLPGDPIKPLYQALDRAVPTTPPRVVTVFLPTLHRGQPPLKVPETIPSLTAVYDTYQPTSDTRQVTFRFEDLQPTEALDVDVLYKIKKKPDWVRRKLSQGEKLRFCFNKPDEDLEKLVLVLSNHAMQMDNTIAGEYSALPLDVPCGEYRLEGNYQVYWGDKSGPLIDSWQFEGEFTLAKEDEKGNPVDPKEPNGWGSFRGQAGEFVPGQSGCAPARMVPWRGQLAIIATVEGETLTVIVLPVQPPEGDLIPDIFNTRLDVFQFGGKVLNVPLKGGTYRWGGGILPIDVDCAGLKPASGGTFTVVKIREDTDSK